MTYTEIRYAIPQGTRTVAYPCDRGTGMPMGYHHFEASPNGVVVCRYCGCKTRSK